MKKLLITHKVDIDGMGPAILARLAFGTENVETYYVDTRETGDVLKAIVATGYAEKFDEAFVTDVCPDKETLDLLNNTIEFKTKLKIFDHHKYVLTDVLGGEENPYSFLNIQLNCGKGAASGTQMFYDFLVNNGLIEKTALLDEIVELTRQYDTWEWKKNNNQNAWKLNTLFNLNGIDRYVDNLTEKAKHGDELFSDAEEILIERERQRLLAIVDEYISKMHVENVLGMRFGVIDDATDAFKNDIADRLRELKVDIAAVVIKISDRNSISFRSILGVDVSDIAKMFGGGGHAAAASAPVSEEILKAFKIENECESKK